MTFELNARQFCERYDVAESTLKKQFTRVKNKMEKQNIKVNKYKENGETFYIVTQEFSNEQLNIGFTDFEVLYNFSNLAFSIMIALSSVETNAYCGSIKKFIEEYMYLTYNDNMRIKFLEVIAELEKEGYILTNKKNVDKGSILLGLEPKMLNQLQFKRYLIKMCKDLSVRYNKKTYIPLFKTIIALFLLTHEKGTDACFTYGDISNITNLSEYYIKDCLQMLSKDNVIRLGNLVYTTDYLGSIRCKGRNIDLNGIKMYDAEENERDMLSLIDETSQ